MNQKQDRLQSQVAAAPVPSEPFWPRDPDELLATIVGIVAGLLVTAEAVDLCYQFVRF